MDNIEKKRILWIDIAKAICIFAVIVGHRGIEQAGFVYAFHLTVFFILSGFTSRVRNIDSSLLKKWFRQLMKPYFLTCLAVLAMELINLVVFNRNFSTAAVTNLIAVDLKRFFFASGGIMNFGTTDMGRFIGAIWFLPAMFFARLIFQLIINLVKDERIQVVASVLVAATGVLISKAVWLPFSIIPGMFAVPFILVGYYTRKYDVISRLKLPHYLLFGGVFVAGCIWGYAQPFYMVNAYAKDYLLTPLFALAGSFTVIGISRLLEKIPTRAFRFFGENSLVVLCVHLFEMNTCYGIYTKIIELMHLPDTKPVRLVLEIIAVIILSTIMVQVKKFLESHTAEAVKKERDITVDVMRGFLILLMIICHSPTDISFHRIVYSFHMPAFVLVSGYFFKSGLPLKVQIKKCMKSLIYYGEFALAYLFVSSRELSDILISIAGGVSYTDKLFSSVVSVGPVYFILLLFAVRLLYVFIDSFFKGYMKDIAVILISAAGIFLGQSGYWLFWSLDCAMFCLLFFHIAAYFRKYAVLKKLNEMPYLYFPLSMCWFLFVLNGSMDLATRRYENIGILLVGSVSAFVLIYMLCSYFVRHWPPFTAKLIALIGESTAYILIFHALFSNRISVFVSEALSLNKANIFYLAVTTVIQLAAGTLIAVLIKYVKAYIRKISGKKKTEHLSVAV